MFKCDDYEQRLDMYKESIQYLETKHKKRKLKLKMLKEEKGGSNDKVKSLEDQVNEL